MIDKLSPSAIRFAKANEGMLFKTIKQKPQSKINITKDKATRERPTTKFEMAKQIIKESQEEPRKILIEILMDKLSINYGTASVYACNCIKMLKSEKSS